MPVDRDAVDARPAPPIESSWSSADCLLYAVGVGAGSIDPTGFELEFTTENSRNLPQRVLPTFAVVLGRPLDVLAHIGPFDWAMLVHGEQSVEVHREIPAEGRVRTTTRVTGVYDKGSGAVVTAEATSVDASSGEPLFSMGTSWFIRGEGGWGGERGPSATEIVLPDRAPDHLVTYATRRDQALIYRLSGDHNPLHSDPQFAELGGFDRPILHGLCTFGFAGRALLHTLCGSDPLRFKRMEVRFSAPVYPGDELTTKIWVDDGEAMFCTERQSGDVVLDRGHFTFVA